MKSLIKLTLLILLSSSVIGAYVQSNQIITYQGRLHDNGSPADGEYDLQFYLLDGPDDETAELVSYPEYYYNCPVFDGYFTVELNFAPENDEFTAQIYATSGSNAFTYFNGARVD